MDPKAYRLRRAGDFNDDGRPDLMFADVEASQDNHWRIWTMNGATHVGDMGFIWDHDAPNSAGGPIWQIVSSVGVGDFNHDGHPDVLSNGGSGNRGDGNYLVAVEQDKGLPSWQFGLIQPIAYP